MKPGDVVISARYGKMVVERIEPWEEATNIIECCWWDGERFLRSHFSADELTVVTPEVAGAK